ncbi:helix-turn-helix domain-containing protein [Alicyclobacillus dauci]|uniref:Helix-turn-helix domain-containing protein n=1 Tax=Alicyclobacillus dauci TaxID=1475485 RepID=A0ABY6Z446_9BACL|nr:helix-turn-helix domain-containing protein [Alicyclobacillus dauci]WAH36770.1 helix-turn-helix domain-containing protein [Alicyclobacillus dauci]
MIGARIQALRQNKGLSLSELADKADVAKSYLSAIERGIQGNPSIQVIEKIASVLDVPVQQLVSGADASEELPLDREWMDLTREVAESGITKEQFREWLEFQRWRLQRDDKNDQGEQS